MEKSLMTTSITFPLPRGWYFGWRHAAADSVSGYHGWRSSLMAFQERLKDLGYDIQVDGFYGPNTNAVVKLFQGHRDLTVDGKIGKHTWAAAFGTEFTGTGTGHQGQGSQPQD